MKIFWILLTASLLTSANATELVPIAGKHCILTKNISIDDLANKSGIIFRGKFEDYEITDENGLSVRKLKFKVIDPIKGIENDSKLLVLKEWAKINSPFSAEEIAKDLDYVFFFNTPSSKGLTSLNGMEQGLVEIAEDGSLKFSKRLNLGNNYSKATLLSVKSDSMNISSYKGLKEFCKVSN